MDIINLDFCINEKEEYENTKEELKELILTNFSAKNDIVEVLISNDVKEMTYGRALISMIIMQPFVNKNIELSEDFLFNDTAVTEKTLDKYFNFILSKCDRTDIDICNVKTEIANILNELADLSCRLTVLAGNTISLFDLIKLYATDPEAAKLFKRDEIHGLQFNEVEREFKDTGKRLKELFKKHPESELYPYIVSETGINMQQFIQSVSFVGLKPDIDGSVIPHVIWDNYFSGFKDLNSYFINTKGTRKALITNASMVRKSGYLTRKLSLLMINRYHDNDIEDCGTEHFTKVFIGNIRKLKMYIGRHYYDIDDKGNKISDLKTIDENSTDLIGKYIGLRSPISCACKNGKVCKTCYGKALSEINKNIHTGLLAVLLITNPLTQKLLSAKHLLTTNSEKVDWGNDLDNILIADMDKLYFDELESSIIINKDKINIDEEEEDVLYVDEITIKCQKKTIKYNSPVHLYINPILFENSDDEEKSDITINSKDYKDYLFKFNVKNNELTKSLQQILDLIESSNHLGIEDYNELADKFADLLIENDLDYIMAVHTEMIARALLVDSTEGKPLDFSKKELDDYTINRVTKSIMNAPLSVSLAFERIPEQLTNPATYEKDEDSLMDALFE